ncbi:MAG: transcription antitermination factor NusB [Steroidobacteraceae bacterium]
MNKPARPTRGNSARVLARKLALQGLYRWQLNRCPWQDLMSEFELATESPRADRAHFQALVQQICEHSEELDTQLTAWCDRPAADLDPVEHAALYIGLEELRSHPEVPYRVVISEAVALARRFGATDGHSFVNAVMDRAARELRPNER